jgi:hypothetical protein
MAIRFAHEGSATGEAFEYVPSIDSHISEFVTEAKFPN